MPAVAPITTAVLPDRSLDTITATRRGTPRVTLDVPLCCGKRATRHPARFWHNSPRPHEQEIRHLSALSRRPGREPAAPALAHRRPRAAQARADLRGRAEEARGRCDPRRGREAGIDRPARRHGWGIPPRMVASRFP